jgi:hypothetical protein
LQISPLGLVPKQKPGEHRVIHHLSYPDGLSINDGIAKEDSFVYNCIIFLLIALTCS